MSINVFQSIFVGIRRRWKRGVGQALAAVGAIWLITQVTTEVSEKATTWLDQNGTVYTALVVAAALAWFLFYTYEPRKVRFQIPTTDSFITVKFGNIFSEDSHWLIGVNEFFDGKLGEVISKNSVHGQFITRGFDGSEQSFRDAVTGVLPKKHSGKKSRPNLPSVPYEIGTTAVVPNGGNKAFLVAMSQTDLETHKASCDVPMLWTALSGALRSIRNHGNGEPVAMPLLGNGLSGVNIEPQHLLRLLTLRLVEFGRKEGLPKNVSIVVLDDCFEQLDIREIARDWKER